MSVDHHLETNVVSGDQPGIPPAGLGAAAAAGIVQNPSREPVDDGVAAPADQTRPDAMAPGRFSNDRIASDDGVPAADAPGHSPATPAEDKPWFRRTSTKIGVVAVGLAVAVGGYFAIHGDSDESPAAAGGKPVAAAGTNGAGNQAAILDPTSTAPAEQAESTVSPEAQKYQIDSTKANADPKGYFTALAKSLEVGPATITAEETRAIVDSTRSATATTDNVAVTNTAMDRLESNRLTAYLNVLTQNQNVRLTPEAELARDQAFMDGLLINPSADRAILDHQGIVPQLQEIAQGIAESRLVHVQVTGFGCNEPNGKQCSIYARMTPLNPDGNEMPGLEQHITVDSETFMVNTGPNSDEFRIG